MTDEQKKQQEEDDAIEGSGFGGKIRIPAIWAGSVGPYLKWPVIAISAGFFIVLLCYGIRLVIK